MSAGLIALILGFSTASLYEKKIHMTPEENEVTFFVYAEEFFFSACELEKSPNTNKVATASYYLFGHSLELAYKSYLYKNGFELKYLKKIGHDLEKAFGHCITKDIESHLEVDEKYSNVVQGINKYYKTKEFEYMSKVEKTYPQLQEVKKVVDSTIVAVYGVLTKDI